MEAEHFSPCLGCHTWLGDVRMPIRVPLIHCFASKLSKCILTVVGTERGERDHGPGLLLMQGYPCKLSSRPAAHCTVVSQAAVSLTMLVHVSLSNLFFPLHCPVYIVHKADLQGLWILQQIFPVECGHQHLWTAERTV